MKNSGFYIGFSLFALQTIAGDIYRDRKQREHQKRIDKMLTQFSSR